MITNQCYARCSDVDMFESSDQQRLLLFNRRTGELMLLLDRPAYLWKKLDESYRGHLCSEDQLILESFYRKGFVEITGVREKSR